MREPSYRRVVRLVLGGLAATVGALALPVLAPPAGAQPGCAQPGTPSPSVPWPQRVLRPDRAWPFATGAGVTIAVLDSGVDSHHPQLAGRVLPGADFLHGGGARGDVDCVGHGTAVASIVDARGVAGAGLEGVAPDAVILPVTVSQRTDPGDASAPAAAPGAFADAVRWAVGRGAKVINLSVAFYHDHAEVHDAVRFALSHDVVLVAAAGDEARPDNPTPYPAAYEGVLGVGAVDQSGTVLPESGYGPYVGLVAPGDAVVGAAPYQGYRTWRGTSFAVPFVAATAALVRQRWPRLTAPEVVARLLATASPTRGGARNPFYGYGMVDPYRAVVDELPAVPAPVPPVPTWSGPDRAGDAEPAAVRAQIRAALAVSGGGCSGAVAVVCAVAVFRSGRRRGWRPSRVARRDPPRDEPPVGPVTLFDDVHRQLGGTRG